MAKNRIQIFRDLNVQPKNPYWAWCAKNETDKRAVFTLWEDLEFPNGKWLIHDKNSSYKKNGYFDQERVLRLAIDNNYETLGVICVAKDIYAAPRKIEEIKEAFILKLEIKDEGDKIYLIKIQEISLLDIIRKDRANAKNDGLNDLDFEDFGSEIPDRALTLGFSVKRNAKVRATVLERAKGNCEYCGSSSFKMKNEKNYLETHHIIFLANEGIDKVSNVIALCSNHHREAHFGVNAEELEKEFREILKNKLSKF